MERVEIGADWTWDQLNHETARIFDPGPDYLTAWEWADRWQVSKATALRRLRRCQSMGRVEMATRTMWRMGDTPYPTPVYKIV